MVEAKVTVVNRLGIHARPATATARLASVFDAEISIEKDGLEVNAKSVMGVMMLIAENGCELSIRAEGKDEKAALEAIVALIEDRFGEE